MTLRASPFGRDTSATSQVHHGRLVSGTRLVAEAALRRLLTERGSLQDDLTYGLPLRAWLGAVSTPGDRLACADRVRGEIAKDPRIQQLSVDLAETRNGVSATWTLSVSATTLDGGSFDLALAADAVSFTVLRLEAQ
jgi:hypothetical protein